MGFGAYLKDLLRPLGLYDLESGPGSAELEVLGAGMDKVFARLTEIERESLLATAEGAGLDKYRELLPYVPPSVNAEERRAAIMSLLRIDDASFTLSALQDTISGCGITARVEESGTPQAVVVCFPNTMGEPENYATIKNRVEQILPCHLDVVYVLRYLIWTELEEYGLTWQQIEGAQLVWTGLECYAGAV